MKDIFSIWLCTSQILLIIFLKHITICHAVDLSDLDNLDRSNYEEPNSNNRRGYYGEPDNVSRANQYYETAYTDGERRTSQQDLARIGSGTKFTKPTNQRTPLYSESRKAYAAALRYSKTRNGDTGEIDTSMAGASSVEEGESNGSIHEGSLANNTAYASVSALVKSNFPKPSQQLGKTDGCTCQEAANEEVSFLCFSIRDGSKNLSIKYRGTTIIDLEDILKGYKFYFDNIYKQVHNFNIEKNLNSDGNLKQESEGDSKLNVAISKFKINEGNFNFNAESKFDINKIKKGDSKFKVNAFGKFDMNTINEDSNKFNIEINKNGGLDIQKYFNSNNNFKTQFGKNINSNSQMEAWKKIQEMAESKTNNKFSLNNNFNGNQFSYEADVQAEAQAEIEAHAKAIAEAEAVAKAQAIFQAQMETEAKAQAVLQNQITAQAHFDAQAKARAKAKAQAEAHAKSQMQINGIGQTQLNSQSQSHAISFSDGNKGPLNNFVNLGVGGEKKIFGNGGFSLGFNGAIGTSNLGTSYGKQAGGGFSFGGGAGGAIGIGGGVGGAIGIGGRVPFTGKSMVGGNDGQGLGTVMAYTGDFNYGDDLYDESFDDGSLSAGYPGVLAFPAPSDSPITGGRLYNNGRIQKDGYAAFAGVTGYQRYP